MSSEAAVYYDSKATSRYLRFGTHPERERGTHLCTCPVRCHSYCNQGDKNRCSFPVYSCSFPLLVSHICLEMHTRLCLRETEREMHTRLCLRETEREGGRQFLCAMGCKQTNHWSLIGLSCVTIWDLAIIFTLEMLLRSYLIPLNSLVYSLTLTL